MKIWYITIQVLFAVIWYLISNQTSQMSKNSLLWKLTSLEWVSTYISFTYFFLALLSSFKSTIIKQKLKISLYLLNVSLLGLSLIVSFVLTLSKGSEEFEETVLDFQTIFTNAFTKGGLFILSLIEAKNLGTFDVPSWTILIIFDVYLTGWYCFVQYMCKKATGSYSYQALNLMQIESLILAAFIMAGISLFIKYLLINAFSVHKVPVIEDKSNKKKIN